jgi:DNA-binding NtrC family response regulator
MLVRLNFLILSDSQRHFHRILEENDFLFCGESSATGVAIRSLATSSRLEDARHSAKFRHELAS